MEGVTFETHKKFIDENAMITNYVDNIISRHNERDLNLLKNTGLPKVVKLLEEKKRLREEPSPTLFSINR